jgi:hypothetical protein
LIFKGFLASEVTLSLHLAPLLSVIHARRASLQEAKNTLNKVRVNIGVTSICGMKQG